jgi:hypothetical protein
MQKSKLQRMSMGRWGETKGAPGVKLWGGGMRVVKQGRTTREEVRGCAGGGDPCAIGLLLQLLRALLLRWLQLGLPLQRRRRATRARGQGQGSGRPGRAGEKRCTSLCFGGATPNLLRSAALSRVRPPAGARFPARSRALSRLPLAKPRAFPPAGRMLFRPSKRDFLPFGAD